LKIAAKTAILISVVVAEKSVSVGLLFTIDSYIRRDGASTHLTVAAVSL